MRTLTKEKVIEKGLCIDDGLCTMCGLCVGVCPTKNINVVFQENEPELSFGDHCNDCGLCYRVCPGKDVPLRDLDRFVFGKERDPSRDLFGVFTGCYQAHAVDPEIRATGAGGGTVSALLIYALEKGLIEGAAVAQMDEEVPWRIKPVLAKNRQEVLAGSGTKPIIVPLNSALRDASLISGNLGGVGLACHVQGLRKLQQRFPNSHLSKRIPFIIGISCGGNGPYRRIAYYLKEWCNIDLDDIRSLRYRTSSHPWHTEVVKKNGEVLRLDFYMHNTSLFQRERCSLCVDWAADLADVSVGDFWGLAAEGSEVHRGANTLLVRTKVGDDLVRGAVKDGYIKIYPTSAGPLALSGGFRHKKHFNLHKFVQFRKYGWPTPDYQYPVAVIPPIDRRGAPYNFTSKLPVDERQRILAKRGTATLWFT